MPRTEWALYVNPVKPFELTTIQDISPYTVPPDEPLSLPEAASRADSAFKRWRARKHGSFHYGTDIERKRFYPILDIAFY